MQHKPLIILSLALTLLISFDYLAAWTVPPSSPPSGNIAAPLNTSGTSQIKTGGLGVGSLDVSGGSIMRALLNLQATGPTLKFTDTTAGERDWWIHANLNRLHFILDRNDDGAWTGENPFPLVLGTGSTGEATQDYALFSNQVRANAYCDRNGANCTSSGGGGIGYGQTWQVVNRARDVWYQNSTSKPIMVFHKNIWDGTIIDVGISPSNFVTMNYQDYDSDLDNGSTIIIPQGNYYRFGTRTENSSNGHYVVRELR